MSKNTLSHVHALNGSPAKQKYSFGKCQRFQYPKPQQSIQRNRTDIYYNPSLFKDKRSALIGMGERSLSYIGDKYVGNTPHSYNIPSTLDTKKGYSLKAGRYENGSPFQNLKYAKDIPAANNYNTPSTLNTKGASMKIRTEDRSFQYLKNVPGPGAYTIPSLLLTDQKGASSKYLHSGSVKLPAMKNQFSLSSSRKVQKMSQPGPGQYDIQKYGIGNPESPYNRNDSTKFPKQKLYNLAVKGAENIPGPGNYKIYSQFDN